MDHQLIRFRRVVVAAAAVFGLMAATLIPGQGAIASTAAVPVHQDAAAAALATGLRALNDFAAASAAALASADAGAARDAYALFDSGWEAIEDGVRARSRDDYRSIEDAMREVDRGLRSDPVDTGAVTQWLGELQNRVNRFVATLPSN